MGRMDKGILQQNPGHRGTRRDNIPETEWGEDIATPLENLYEKRQQAGLTRIMKEGPEIETWANQDYPEQDIDREIRNLSLRKAHGNDGIPGEA